jgi:hypothetical protein
MEILATIHGLDYIWHMMEIIQVQLLKINSGLIVILMIALIVNQTMDLLAINQVDICALPMI